MRFSVVLVAAGAAVASASEFNWAHVARQVQQISDGQVQATSAPFPSSNATSVAATGTGSAAPTGTTASASQVTTNAAAAFTNPAVYGILAAAGLLAL